MLEALQFEFIKNAIIAGMIAGIICGIIGTLVVVNRLVFLSGGIAHAAYGGIGLAYFSGFPYILGTMGFSLIAAMVMAWVTLNAKHRSDTIIGVIWATGMAIGVILLDLSPGYNADLMSYLFGSILTVLKADLYQMLILCSAIMLLTAYYYNDFLAMSYDSEFASLRGIHVKGLYFLLIGMIALSIVMIIRIVGLILVIALLTIPPFIAEQYSKSLFKMMVLSCALNILFAMAGLWISYLFNLTAGATIILIAGAGFFISLAIKKAAFK